MRSRASIDCSRIRGRLVRLLALALQIGPMSPLVGLDVLETPLGVANSVKFFSGSAAVGSAPTLGHREVRA